MLTTNTHPGSKRLNKTDRQQWILSEVSNSPAVRVGELAERLGVTTETIRRDLKVLTDSGQLSRTYGGATRPPMIEPGVAERHKLFSEQRQLIARRTVRLIQDAKSLYIGSGATTTQLARRIAFEMKDVTVYTHSFGVATVLSVNPQIDVIILPGHYQAREGATYGAQGLRFIEAVQTDFAVVGASGIMPDGPNVSLPELAEISAAMIRHSNVSIIVADHSKVMRRFTNRFATWREITTLVSDQPLTAPPRPEIVRAGTQIIDQPP